MDGARRCADGHRAIFRDRQRSAGPHRRIQAVRGAGFSDHGRSVAIDPAAMRRWSRYPVLVTVAMTTVVTACSRPSSLSQPVAAAPTSSSTAGYLPLTLSSDAPPPAEAPVHVSAAGFPPSGTIELAWGTVSGGWIIEDYYHFRGKKYSET